jgi:hypothetical protein
MGWLALGALVLAFAAIAWWLFLSPLPNRIRPAGTTVRARRARRLVATLMLVSAASFLTGARWDEIWHRKYGGFGDDFLWPPHLMLYASLGLNAIFAALGLGLALRGAGSLRERFRQEPVMGFLGLMATYQMASIPSDLLWHEIIGPDITAWSLPHALLALTTTAVLLAGVAIALSARAGPGGLQPDEARTPGDGAASSLHRASYGPHSWRRLPCVQPMEQVALALTALSLLALLQIGTTEWEWSRPGEVARAVLQRPAWAYPVVVLLVGVAHASLALHATHLTGAATAVTAGALGAQMVAIGAARLALPPGPALASHALLLPPALALDAWHAWWLRRQGRITVATAWMGAPLYTAVYVLVAFPYIAAFLPAPRLDAASRLATVAIGLPAALVVSGAGAYVGRWLRAIGSPAPAHLHRLEER